MGSTVDEPGDDDLAAQAGGLADLDAGRLEGRLGLGQEVVGELHVAGLGHRAVGVVQVEVDEGRQLGLRLEVGLVDVDEQRPRERVAAVGDGVDLGGDAGAVLTGDLHLADTVTGAFGEREPDPTERAVGALDAVDDGVVLGARGVAHADRGLLLALFGDRREAELDERVVGAGLGAGTEDLEVTRGVLGGRPELLGEGLGVFPGGDVGRLGAEDRVQVFLVEAVGNAALRRALPLSSSSPHAAATRPKTSSRASQSEPLLLEQGMPSLGSNRCPTGDRSSSRRP